MKKMRALVIIPTKNRKESLEMLLSNLSLQVGPFDIFIGDMSTDPHLLEKSELMDKIIQRCIKGGHEVTLARVEGHNQLFGYNAGLKFAEDHGYEFGVGTDDDIVFEPGWLDHVIKAMWRDTSISTYVGLTLIPWLSIEEQRIPRGFALSLEFQGKLTDCHYQHCTMVPRDELRPQEFEQVYGAFGFRVDDYVKVGGFPEYLSPLGFRGEMMAQVATSFAGKKQVMDPSIISWHYSCFHGGLREVQGDMRKVALEHDMKLWQSFVARHEPSTLRCEV